MIADKALDHNAAYRSSLRCKKRHCLGALGFSSIPLAIMDVLTTRLRTVRAQPRLTLAISVTQRTPSRRSPLMADGTGAPFRARATSASTEIKEPYDAHRAIMNIKALITTPGALRVAPLVRGWSTGTQLPNAAPLFAYRASKAQKATQRPTAGAPLLRGGFRNAGVPS